MRRSMRSLSSLESPGQILVSDQVLTRWDGMKKYVGIVLLAAFLVLFVIVPVITHLTSSEARTFQWVKLEDTIYREVSFQNSTQNIELAGMLFMPEGEGPFPAAVIIQGSGTSRRDSGWYLTLTQYLQENGIAVLLPDKRGSEQSEGDWRTSSFEDLATDTLAGISFLKDQKDVAIKHIGVVGMSQGGRIAPIVASGSSDVVFLVNVVGGSIPAHDGLFYEENHNLRQMGLMPGLSNLTAYVSTFILKNMTKKDFWDAVGNFDPIPYWERVTVNSLVLYGRDDTNTHSIKSAARLRALDKSNIEVEIYEGSGHPLEDPEGQGNSIFRGDAMRSIRDFIYSAQALP